MASDGTIKIDTELDSSKAKSAMSEFSSLAETALKGVKIAVGAVSAAMTAMAAYSVKVGSDFEAGMSKVSAISGATGSDLAALSDKAKEMGSKTKFSATEAASAFEFMAMAGWKTEDMLNGIEGVMNLAAASGEDLASVSDIVTDALTAFGLQASDSAHFADVLATAASNSNTNVGMMGETFKYVAPVAGSLGFSAEDCAVAIGLMANSGIKASQAGTSLRQLFTNLVKPTDQMQEVMDKLGFSLMDAEGNTKSLDTVMKELRTSFTGLTDAEKAQYAATLAGQEGMSGFLAIVNASDSDFQGLTSAIRNADGAAEKMAETMNDNLKGSITIAGSALEGFGIKVYEKMEQPLKKAVDIGTDCINRLSASFDSGGLNGVVKEAGDIFNELADDISGTSKVAAGIVTPFKNIANTGASLGKTVFPVVVEGLEFTAENLDALLPLVVGVTAGFKAFNVIGKATATATKANAAAVAVLNKMEKANALQLVATNGGLTARQAILAVHNGQITLTTALTGLWTKAQIALNTAISANPLGVAVAAAVAFIAVGKAIEATVTRQTEAEREHSKALRESKRAAEESLQNAQERKRSYEELVQSQNEQAAGDIAQLNRLRDLNGELNTIVDANGRVKEGEEDRAAFITSQLSSALGIEISMTDNQISNYQELQSQLQSLIEQKRIDAIMSAEQAKYDEAVANQMKVAAEASANLTAMKEADIAVTAEKAELSSLEAEKDQAVIDGNKALVKILDEKIRKQEEDVTKAEEALKATQEAYTESTELLAQYANDIDQYTSLAEAATSGNAEAIEAAINRITSGIKTASVATNEELQKQVIEIANTEDLIRQEVEKGTPGFTQAMMEQAQSATVAALEEFAKAAPQSAEELSKVSPEAVGALIAGDMKGQLSAEASGAVEGMLKQFDGLDGKTKDNFAKVWYGALEGLEGFETLANPAKEGADTFLESLKTVLEIHSPSEAVKRIFSYVWPGAADGLNEGSEGLKERGIGVITSFFEVFSDVPEKVRGIGAQIMEFFGLGVSSQQENSRNSGKLNADAANEGAGSVDPTGTGSNFGAMLGNGVSSMAGNLLQTGLSIADSANSGAGSVNPTGTGNRFGDMLGRGVGAKTGSLQQEGRRIADSAKSGAGSVNPSRTGNEFGSQYASGIGSRTYEAMREGQSLASHADSGARSEDGYDAGSSFGSGFVSGIGGWIASAASKAAELARSALNAAKRALDSHSPSKKARKIGKTLPQGFGLGIEDDAGLAEKASANMAETALDALSMDELALKVKSIRLPEMMDSIYMAVEERNAKVAEKVTASVAAREKLKDSGNQNLSVSKEDIRDILSDMSKLMVREIAETMEGMGVYLDKKPVGRIMAPVIDDELGRIGKRKT